MNPDYNKIMSVIDEQEHLLRIDRFSSEFALSFGLKMVELAKERGIAMGISIR